MDFALTGLQRKGLIGRFLGRAIGFEVTRRLTGRFHGKDAAAGLAQEMNFHLRVILGEFEGRRRAGVAFETDTSEPVESILGVSLCGGRDAPAFPLHLDTAMAVPCPGFRDEHEAVASVAEMFLQKIAHVGGDGIGCDGGISIVQHARDRARSPQFGAPQGEIEGAKIFVDKKSLLFLNGTVLDYDTNLISQGFVFSNPNAKSTCGCGSSFGA